MGQPPRCPSCRPVSEPRPPVKVMLVLLGLGTGGAERSIVDMAPYLRDRGVELHIACRGNRSVGAEADLQGSGAQVSFSDNPGFARWVRQLRGLIDEVKPDVVHTTLYTADLAGRIAALGSDTPVMSSIVNESYSATRKADPAISPWKLEVTRRIEGGTARHLTSHTHALTESVAASCVTELGLDRSAITVIPRGRESSRLGRRSPERRAAARRELGVGDASRLVLAVGRQEYQKGHDTLMAAFAEVLRQEPDAVLVLAGRPGVATPAIDSIVESSGIADSVIRTGHVDHVAELFCAADVFAFPSRFEGLGGVLLEAMALEAPIVASDIGPIRETVGGDAGAVLVPVDDPAALAEGVLRVLGDPALAERLADHGRARFETSYSMEHVADSMASLYREVAAGGRRTVADRLPRRNPNR